MCWELWKWHLSIYYARHISIGFPRIVKAESTAKSEELGQSASSPRQADRDVGKTSNGTILAAYYQSRHPFHGGPCIGPT